MSASADEVLITRIRERIADPERRVDSRPSEFFASVQGQSLAGLLTRGRSNASDLRRVIADDRSDDVIARAESFADAMNRPAERPLPGQTSREQLAASEQRLGVALPPLLRRLYTEVANGGFGPSNGIIGVAGGWTDGHARTIEDLFADMSDPDPEWPEHVWPAGLVPICDSDGVLGCVDTTSADGRIVEWDPDELDDDAPDGRWDAAFSEVAPSLSAWLVGWLDASPQPEGMAADLQEHLDRSTIEQARQSQAMIGQMSLEERRAMGLPDEGWERVVWGGIGLDEDVQ